MDTTSQKQRRKEFQATLLFGFLNFEELEREIYDQNPDLTGEEVRSIKGSLDRFHEFFQNSELTQSVVSELTISQRNQLTFNGGVKFKIQPLIA
jgi:hypothetical protein